MKAAVDMCIKHKRVEIVRAWREEIDDPELREYIEEKLANLQR
jgi:hypothetical protein